VSALWDRPSSGQRAALYIRSLIFEGTLRSGDRISQDDIGDALGFSRLPVREAIIALEHEGLVTSEPHRGVFINPITADTFRDQYELFGSTLGIAIRLAATRSGLAFVDQLAAINDDLQAATDVDEFDAANDAFNSLIVEGARSPRLRAVLRVLSGIVPGNYFEEVPGGIAIQATGATAVVEALREHDADAASAACLHTMRAQAEAVVALLSSRGFFERQQPATAEAANTERVVRR